MWNVGNQCWPESSLQCEKIVCRLPISIFLLYFFSKFMCSISIVLVISCWFALIDRDCVVDMRRDVQEIFKLTPHDKQVMMFSATLSKEIRPVCKRFMQDVMSCSQLIPLLVWGHKLSFLVLKTYLSFLMALFPCLRVADATQNLVALICSDLTVWPDFHKKSWMQWCLCWGSPPRCSGVRVDGATIVIIA
jgi:hypothetical protein